MTLYEGLNQFINGEINYKTLIRLDEDGILSCSGENKKNLEKTVLNLNFDLDKFITLFVNDDDRDNNNEYLINASMKGYSYYGKVFVDDYFGEEEFKYGYIVHFFNEENIKLLKDIFEYINPTYINFENQEITEDAFRFFYEMFPSQSDDIGYEYAEYYDDALVIGLREYLENKFCGKLHTFNLFEVKCTKKYITTVGTIKKLYEKLEDSKNDDITKMLNRHILNAGMELDEDLYEDYYAYFDSRNFDSESYNRNVNRILEKIYEKLLSEVDDEIRIQNRKIYDKLQSMKFEIGKWYNIPKEPDKKFKVDKISDGKLVITFRKFKPYSNQLSASYTLEQFMNILYNFELF